MKGAPINWELMAKDATWRQKALCRDLDTSIFFPETESRDELRVLYAEARKYCNECIVRNQCLEAALREEEHENTRRYGMRGGKTPSQRKGIRAQQRMAHGYSLYTMGCRCDICRNANTKRCRVQRANKAS